MPEATNLEPRYLEQGAKPKVRLAASKQSKDSEKTNVALSSVKSTGQKSTKVQDVKGTSSGFVVRSSEKAEGVDSVKNAMSKDDMAMSAELPTKKIDVKISSKQAKAVQSSGDEFTEDWHTSRRKSEKGKKARPVSGGISGKPLDTCAAVGHASDMPGTSTAQVVKVPDPVSKAEECSLEDRYLIQGAKPKVRGSQSHVVKKVVNDESDVQKSKVVQSTAQKKIAHSSSAGSADCMQGGTNLTSVQTAAVGHMQIKRVFDSTSKEEFRLSAMKFKENIKCFARMHIDYIADFMFGVFDVKGDKIALKPRILNALLKISGNSNLLIFMVKSSLARHLLLRTGFLALLAYFKYCASHYYDPKHLDELLVSVMHLGIYNLKTVSPPLKEVLFCFHDKFKENYVFGIYNSSFYDEVLSMFYDFASADIRDPELRMLSNLLKISCAVQLGNMYRLIIQSGDMAMRKNEEITKCKMYKRKSVGYSIFHARVFSNVCCKARMVDSHLYGTKENRICTVRGFSFPGRIINTCSNIFSVVEEHVTKGTMNFEVFANNAADYLTRSLLMKETIHLVRKDIVLYKNVVESKYRTVGGSQYSLTL
ncbi:DUF3514 domain-containing protein [Ehrlichia minasensis]|uniref:DUF3514 domain-containing protein n=1 Tax=Ehrlichia minasensis TaxID=1242993 RepID=A0A4Q6I739_9RICK|nr:DUF3514 domain-containing protein [Ehrlichia minasensis]RZB12409.1 DUF3514 domain-containing protein [Ehrlichia minasensis]